MAIIGFMFGALVVIVLRALQGLDPLWNPGVGLVIAPIFMAAFFVWGIGAFNPKLSIHGDEEAVEAAHEAMEAAAESPRGILIGTTWQLLLLVLVLLILVGGFAALPGGLALTQTVVPGASTTMVGYAQVDLPFGLPSVEVSTLVIFIVFILWAFVSLAVAGWIIALVMGFISRGIIEVKLAPAGAAALPAPTREERAAKAQNLRAIAAGVGMFIVLFIILYELFYNVVFGIIFKNPAIPGVSLLFDAPTQQLLLTIIFTFIVIALVLGRERTRLITPYIVWFFALYVIFYYVAIGLIFPQPSLPLLNLIFDSPTQLIILSLVNAVVFTIIILQTQLVLNVIGIVAKWLAFQLRRIPNILQ
ncbi:MAG TPA: hypothetical protein VHD90_04735 [Phototrophicaceae bacterium]|nr:hypothetical protein [Phototrophicaceae bacterium]